MYAPPFLSSGGAWGQPLPPPPLNPNLSLQNSINLYTYLSNLASCAPHYGYNVYPTFPIQNPSFPIQNPNFPIQNPNFPIQNPILTSTQFSNPAFRPHNSNELLERIDRAVGKARSVLIAAGDSVSAWKVSQSALLILQVDCWSSLGFQMQQVPSLHRLMLTEGKINAFIHCFVGVRRITSLCDLEVAICKNEGIEQFEQLGLGPLLRNPLVLHYFSVKCDATEVFKITSEEIISLLFEFLDTCKHTYIRVEEFLDFIVKKCSVASKEELGIRIHSLGMHISAIRFARDIESSALKKSGELIIQKPDTRCSTRPLRQQQDERFTTSIHKEFCDKHIRFESENEGSDDEYNDHVPSNQVNSSSHSAKSSNRVNSGDGLVVSSSQSKGPLHSLKKELDEGFSTISRGVESIFSQFCGKHTRFDYAENSEDEGSAENSEDEGSAENSEDEGSDDNLYDEEDYNHDQLTCSVVNYSSQSGRSSDRVSSCPYPSAVEERERLGLDELSPAGGSQKHNEINESVKKKRKSENIISAISLPPNLRKRDKVEQDARPIENGREVNEISNLDRRKAENWPPGDWRTAPRYDYSCTNGIKTQEPILQPISAFQNKVDDNSEGFVRQTYKLAPISDNPEWGAFNFSKRDRLSTCTPDAIQAKETGRLGELAAFKYFIEKAGKSAVKWVNEHSETRLPYDIVVGENEDSKEFIEVKATRNPTKDWFEMSVRQLQFAVEQGEAFSIAHVILSDNNVATVRVYNNLEKLLMKQNNQEHQDQDCKLKLVVLVLEPQKEFTIVS